MSDNFDLVVLKILSNINIDTTTSCHIYQGNIDTVIGYGRVMIDGVRYHTHRLAAYAFLGLDLNDPKEFACHKCSNRACCNPDHIYVGDNQENQRDAVTGVCKYGHVIEDSNIVWHRRKSGIYFRHCRICHNASTRKSNAKRKGKVG